MSGFAFRKHETAAESLRRIVDDLLQSIRELIPQTETSEKALHEISKATKRLVAIACLIPGSEGKAFEHAIQHFRHPIGPRRDAEVMRSIWKEFCERLVGTTDIDQAMNWEALAQRHSQDAEKGPEETAWLGDLDAIDREWKQVELPSTKAPWFLDAVRKEYRRGHRIVKPGLHSASDRLLHKVRKTVKRTQYQLELMHKACPSRLSPEHDLWLRLGDLLGRQHDLSVFREAVDRPTLDRLPQGLAESLVAALEEKQSEVTRTIEREAPQAYLFRPRDFAGFLQRAWEHWRHPAE
ncbi:MAG: CHAD domain-containing protein [Planctomycetaceae bacterium]|nr:CHAD domain-containing protein [Planctomycetaceae bacterium]